MDSIRKLRERLKRDREFFELHPEVLVLTRRAELGEVPGRLFPSQTIVEVRRLDDRTRSRSFIVHAYCVLVVTDHDEGEEEHNG